MSEQVTDRELHILRHSLGLTRGKRMYRNHFAADPGGDDYQVCSHLLENGLMILGRTDGGLVFFHVTDKGKKQAKP